MKKQSGQLIYSPTDLVRYLESPFISWMDRYYLENPDAITPDEDTEDDKLRARTGDEHELSILEEFKSSFPGLVEIPKKAAVAAQVMTLAAIKAKAPIIYQAALQNGEFAGFVDFLILNDDSGQYQVWDAKLAHSPRPHYAIQLCCYSEMLAAITGSDLPHKFGIILGNKEKERVEFHIEDFIHYYRRIKKNFLSMQNSFDGNMVSRPALLPRADNGRWTSCADKIIKDTDHLVSIAGILVSQIKKLNTAGIMTVADLAKASGKSVRKLAEDSLEKLVVQARLQHQTRIDRDENADAPARYEILPQVGMNQEPLGLATLPPDNSADVYFDMEGYPLIPGGLEYLFGVCSRNQAPDPFEFNDWWAHDRDEEKLAFEGFIDWINKRWRDNPGMHIYHYANYEVAAIRRLSTRHNTRQDEVDELLRNEVFVDLYLLVRHGLRIGEDGYSLKKIELLYRPHRRTEVGTAVDSIVQYAHWMGSKQSRDWKVSTILKSIRDYNEDDCKSTAELVLWLRKVATENNITTSLNAIRVPEIPKELPPEVVERLKIAEELYKKNDPVSIALADLVDFHRREEKTRWWRMYDRAEATSEELYDDPACIDNVLAVGDSMEDGSSMLQNYQFNPAQEIKLDVGKYSTVMFTHNLVARFTLSELDLEQGTLQLKITKGSLYKNSDNKFPEFGSLIPFEYVSAKVIQEALTDIARQHLSEKFTTPVVSILGRKAPAITLENKDESVADAAIRITSSMLGECLVIQGPPGTGKTYTAAKVIDSLLASGKKVGVTSNSHKAVDNLLIACGEAAKESGRKIRGIKVRGDNVGLFSPDSGFMFIDDNKAAFSAYRDGVIGGTAWLFTRPEWVGALDYLFIDEAGQVSLANAIAMARCAKNLVIIGDQMQLEQPIQGSHPGDSGLSCLQYALKDLDASKPDLPIFHSVVPPEIGLFLGESRRMHPSVCRFISESIYEGRLSSHPDCVKQRIVIPTGADKIITKENGIVFNGIEHDEGSQRSDDEVKQVVGIYQELLGRPYTSKDGSTRPLELKDFLFIAPYNAQVRALRSKPELMGARIGSVDKFQGLEAPVCILSLCSSFGEYGSRGLAFILDRNRMNVAISRAQCLAIVVADPRIASAVAGSIDEMKLINVLCRLVDLDK